jgi:hypothetical protein
MLHDTKDVIARVIKSTEAAEIRHYHSQPHLMPTGDQHYCDRPLVKLLRSMAMLASAYLSLSCIQAP